PGSRDDRASPLDLGAREQRDRGAGAAGEPRLWPGADRAVGRAGPGAAAGAQAVLRLPQPRRAGAGADGIAGGAEDRRQPRAGAAARSRLRRLRRQRLRRPRGGGRGAADHRQRPRSDLGRQVARPGPGSRRRGPRADAVHRLRPHPAAEAGDQRVRGAAVTRGLAGVDGCRGGWVVATAAGARVVATFAELNGGPLRFSKKTAEGLAERRALLRPLFGTTPAVPGTAVDDVLDAYALLWSATGPHAVLGNGERDVRGLHCEIVI